MADRSASALGGSPSRPIDGTAAPARQSSIGDITERRVERETGIEPATNSLEGCDSTTELLPPSRPPRSIHCLSLPDTSYHFTTRTLRACIAGPEGRVEWWAGEDSNLRSPWGGRFTVCCD
jgi:hypothetical protein